MENLNMFLDIATSLVIRKHPPQQAPEEKTSTVSLGL